MTHEVLLLSVGQHFFSEILHYFTIYEITMSTFIGIRWLYEQHNALLDDIISSTVLFASGKVLSKLFSLTLFRLTAQ